MKTEFSKDFIGIFDDQHNRVIINELIEWYDQLTRAGITNTVYGVNDETRAFTESTPSTPFKNPTYDPSSRKDAAVSIPQLVPSEYMNYFLMKKYQDYISDCLIKYIEHYSLMLDSLVSIYSFKIHKVKPTQGYHSWHYENGGTWNRAMVFMTYLTIPEEGGETEFLYQSIRIKPVAGRTLIWPAGYTHVHRGNPPIKGEKMYASGWFEYTLSQ